MAVMISLTWLEADARFSINQVVELRRGRGSGTGTNTDNEITESPTDPKTESPTDPKTESPTDTKTESPTDPKTESPTDPKTESPTESPTLPPTESPTSESPPECVVRLNDRGPVKFGTVIGLRKNVENLEECKADAEKIPAINVILYLPTAKMCQFMQYAHVHNITTRYQYSVHLVIINCPTPVTPPVADCAFTEILHNKTFGDKIGGLDLGMISGPTVSNIEDCLQYAGWSVENNAIMYRKKGRTCIIGHNKDTIQLSDSTSSKDPLPDKPTDVATISCTPK